MFLFFRVDLVVRGNGYVKCKEWTDVRVGIAGIINNVRVREGEWVIEGDVLLMLDEKHLALDVNAGKLKIKEEKIVINSLQHKIKALQMYKKTEKNEAESKVIEAKARLNDIENGLKPEEIILAKQKIKRSEEILRQSQINAVQMQRAYDLKLISGQIVKEALHNLSLAQIDKTTVETELALLQKKYNENDWKVANSILNTALTKKEQILSNKYDLIVLQGDLERAKNRLVLEQQLLSNKKHQLSLVIVRAPIAGYVMTQEPEHLVGRVVQDGSSVIRIGDHRKFVVECCISERDSPLLMVGQKARVFIHAFPQDEYKLLTGTVIKVGVEANNINPEAIQENNDRVMFKKNERYTSVLVELDENSATTTFGKKDNLRPGFSADLDIITGSEYLWILLLRKVLRIKGMFVTEKLQL